MALNFIKSVTPDPLRGAVGWPSRRKEQQNKVRILLRRNNAALEKQIANCKNAEKTAEKHIKSAASRSQGKPALAKQAASDARMFARELLRARKQTARVTTSRAQLESVGMQVREAFAMDTIQKSMENSKAIMQGVNALVRLPELTGTMRELNQELMKAGIVEEMVGDMIPDNELLDGEDEAADAEINKVLGEILKTPVLPEAKVQGPTQDELESFVAQQNEPSLDSMRGRLEALKS